MMAAITMPARRVRRQPPRDDINGCSPGRRVPDRLHDRRARGRRARCRAVPPAHPRRVQGAA
ncbi:hypothetical protein DRA43_32260, partial [Micromonospora provocatoris]